MERGVEGPVWGEKIEDGCVRLRNRGVAGCDGFDSITPAHDIGAPVVELHTGEYANATARESAENELLRLKEASTFSQSLGLVVNAGHGLTKFNVAPIAAIEGMNELNIGHSLIARSLMVGLPAAVKEFREIMDRGCR